MENFPGIKRPKINLSLFTALSGSFSLTDKNNNKSPRNFENGVVGLGIVAAMTDLSENTQEVFFPAKAASPRSSPIPIVSSAKPAANFRDGLNFEKDGGDVDELSESYTCVISHVENNLITKRVYYDDKVNLIDECMVKSAVFSSSPLNFGAAETEFCVSDFLSSCFLCNKQLHGLDIFMYRGEKAFCSVECREKQIRSDDYREKCGSEAMKSLDYSGSPCADPLVFSAGVVAA